jgi:hypothetical protein
MTGTEGWGVTHPFHLLYGRDFEFVAHRHNWGEDRVHLHDENGKLFSLPAGWTDVAAPDPFVVVAAGRCPFTAEGLLAAADLAGLLRARGEGRDVKRLCRERKTDYAALVRAAGDQGNPRRHNYPGFPGNCRATPPYLHGHAHHDRQNRPYSHRDEEAAWPGGRADRIPRRPRWPGRAA